MLTIEKSAFQSNIRWFPCPTPAQKCRCLLKRENDDRGSTLCGRRGRKQGEKQIDCGKVKKEECGERTDAREIVIVRFEGFVWFSNGSHDSRLKGRELKIESPETKVKEGRKEDVQSDDSRKRGTREKKDDKRDVVRV